MSADISTNQPIHVAITRRIKPGCEAEFQEALREFFKTSLGQAGVHGASMLVPPPGSTCSEYGILRTRWRDKHACAMDTGLRSEEHTSELQSHLNLVCRL